MHCLSDGEEAVAFCGKKVPDLILISLSLPNGFGFTLFQILRSNPPTRGVPILGLVVKTATQEQSLAQQLGFNDFITKPIDLPGLPQKITRVLGLDTSHQMFERRENSLVLTLPSRIDKAEAGELEPLFRSKLADAVDDGFRHVIIDFSAVVSLDENLIKLGARLVEYSTESEIQHTLVGPETLRASSQGHPASKDWQFVASVDTALKGPAGKRPGSPEAGSGIGNGEGAGEDRITDAGEARVVLDSASREEPPSSGGFRRDNGPLVSSESGTRSSFSDS